jgi:AraC family transcriptional regulator of adaptative response / DNA-3-methyladenine glycosylase II
VSRALRLIGEGALDGDGVERLADRLGVTGRHLRRLFRQHLGATPLEVALTRRAHFAKKLLDETALGFDEVAFASGFGSLRRFNAQIRRTFRRTPRDLRRLARRRIVSDPECYRFRLAYRPPYDWGAMLAFLGSRAIPGVESVEESRYRRTIAVDGKAGVIEVSPLPDGSSLGLSVRFPDPRALLVIVERVRRLFDLGADPAVIAEHLGGDPLLRGPLAEHPGIRAPGAWDGFEIEVTAILGQRIAGRVAAMFGSPVTGGFGLERLFPTAGQLSSAPLERAGAGTARAGAIRSLARQVSNGTPASATCAALPGIDERAAEYIAMRALGEPDAFPSGDPDLCGTAERWRPWRAYAFMLLWQDARDDVAKPWRTRNAQSGSSRSDPLPLSARAESNRVVEVRSYNLKPGTRERFHQRFLAEALPMLERFQVDVVNYGPSLHDSDSYYLIRLSRVSRIGKGAKTRSMEASGARDRASHSRGHRQLHHRRRTTR